MKQQKNEIYLDPDRLKKKKETEHHDPFGVVYSASMHYVTMKIFIKENERRAEKSSASSVSLLSTSSIEN